MSLINDALRRAKDAQQQAPPPPSPDLPFRPVEPAPQRARRGPGLLLTLTLAAVALFTLLFVCQWVQPRDLTGLTAVNARTAPVARATPTPTPVSASVEADTPTPALATQPGSATQPNSPPSPATNAPVADAQESEATNTAAVTPPPPPKPAPLRLQAIVFNPRRPSAMISGKTLFVGDKLGDLRVVAIDQQSATLAGAGQTNILSLSE
jgi:hypothetical protein